MKQPLEEKLKAHVEKLKAWKRNKELRQKDAIEKSNFIDAGILQKEIMLLNDEITALFYVIYD